MLYRKPIISTYSINNEACIPYLQKYPLSLLLDELNIDLESQIITLNNFIYKNINKRVDIDIIEKNFVLNKPDTFVRTIMKL
jgi:hypothetical protein